MENEQKNIEKPFYKKWWFWVIIIVVSIIMYVVISKYVENQKLEKTFENMGKGASDFISGVDNAKSHIDEFNYNSVTGEVDYNREKTWLEKYNLITVGMEKEKVEEILGKGYKTPDIDENAYYLNWGTQQGLKDKQVITISFYNNKVTNKTQLGLK